MSTLIEDMLRSRGVRYFRGHHSDEYFFLVNLRHGRLHVHLDADATGGVTIVITPDRYFPARLRGRIADLAATAPAVLGEVTVQNSCDPRLVGVATSRWARPAAGEELGADAEAAVAAAIALFTGIGDLAGEPALLKDAG